MWKVLDWIFFSFDYHYCANLNGKQFFCFVYCGIFERKPFYGFIRTFTSKKWCNFCNPILQSGLEPFTLKAKRRICQPCMSQKASRMTKGTLLLKLLMSIWNSSDFMSCFVSMLKEKIVKFNSTRFTLSHCRHQKHKSMPNLI